MDRMTQEDRIKHYANLIQRQTGKAVRPYRADGYVNMVNRYGTTKDSSEQYNFIPEGPVSDDVLESHYEGNGLFAKIIDMPAEEAVKHGFVLEDIEDGKLADFYNEALDELNWEETAMTAIKWTRLFGGSIAVMLVNDGRGLEEPLDWKNIQSIDDIRVYDRSIIQPDYSSVFNYDPTDPFRVRGSRLGMPEFYDIYSRYGSFRVHDSRCLVFQNGILPENTTNSIYQFWGVPEYIRLNKAIRDADVAHRSAPKLLERSVQPIYKMRGLASELATEQGEDRILKRLQVIDTARGILNSLVIDADGEDYDFKTFQYNGITDVISASCNMLSALSNIPQVILFGQTISGMSSTDDTSMENYYNYVERIQKRMLKSNLRYLLSVIFQAGLATGEVDEVPNLKIKFNPLWSVSDTEQATLDQQKAQTEQVKAQTAQIYVGMEAIDPSEVRSKLADSDEFDVENMLDEYTEEEIEAGMPSNDKESAQAPDGQPMTPGSQSEGLSAVGKDAPDPSAMVAKVSVDPHEKDPGTEGDEPASAPAATKQPADMSREEKAKAAQARQSKEQDREDTLHTDSNNSHSESSNGSVGVIVVNGGRILNGTRHNDFGYGLVCGPGGHIEEGETPEQAAFRETKEEFGIMPKSLMCLGQGPKEKDTGLKPYLFLCTEYYGTPNCEDLEMTGAKFSTMEELDEKAESLFGPFADGLNILMDCLETGIFYTDPAEGVTDEKLNAHLEKAMNSDGGPGSGNFGHEGRPGEVGGSSSIESAKHTVAEVSDRIPTSPLHPEYVYGSKIFGGVVDENVGTEARKAFKNCNASPTRKTFKLSDLKTDQSVNRISDIRKMIELCPSYNDVAALSSKDPIKVVRHKGNNILIDGNTRASVAKIYGINEIPVDFYDLDSATEHGDGGPGSGNFGHEGRHGKVGGSTPGDIVSEQCGKMTLRLSDINAELVKCNEEMISKGMSPQLMTRMQSLVSESQKIKSDLEIYDPSSKANVAKRLCKEGHPTEEQVIDSFPKEWRESYDPSGEHTYGEEFSAKIGSWCGEGYKGLKNDKIIDKAIRTSSAKWKSGNLYRGLSVDESQLSALKPGATIKMDGLSSWSSDISPAMSFATTENDPVLIVDKTTGVRNALSIAQMSSRSWEKEVLYCSDQEFTIKSVATRPVDYGESASGNAGDFSKKASRKVTVIEVEANSD